MARTLGVAQAPTAIHEGRMFQLEGARPWEATSLQYVRTETVAQSVRWHQRKRAGTSTVGCRARALAVAAPYALPTALFHSPAAPAPGHLVASSAGPPQSLAVTRVEARPRCSAIWLVPMAEAGCHSRAPGGPKVTVVLGFCRRCVSRGLRFAPTRTLSDAGSRWRAGESRN